MTEQDLPAVKSLMQSIANFWHKNWKNETLLRALHAAGDLALVFLENKIKTLFRAVRYDIILARKIYIPYLGHGLLD